MNHNRAREVSSFSFDVSRMWTLTLVRFKNKLLPVMFPSDRFSGKCYSLEVLFLLPFRVWDFNKSDKIAMHSRTETKAKIARRFFVFRRADLEHKKIQHSIDPIKKWIELFASLLLSLLPALSPILQLMWTSHSDASIVEAAIIALSRTYFDRLTSWLMMDDGWIIPTKRLRLVCFSPAKLLLRLDVWCCLSDEGCFFPTAAELNIHSNQYYF